MVKIKQENIKASLEMYGGRLVQLSVLLSKIEKQYEKKMEKIQQEINEISEAMNILESLSNDS